MMITNRAGSGDETTQGGKGWKPNGLEAGPATTAELVEVREAEEVEEGQRKQYEGHW